MDNTNSQPSLVPPSLPSDFESQAGTSKSDFALAMFALLAGAEIIGINQSEPNSFDINSLIGRMEALEQKVDALESRKPVFVTVNGVLNGTVVVPFPRDLGTEIYSVNAAFLTPNEDLPNITWSVVTGSKTSTQVTLKIDGDAASYDLEVMVTPMVNL